MSRSTEMTRCLPPKGYGTATPGIVTKPRTQEIHGGVEYGLFRHRGAGQTELNDGNAGGRILDDQGRKDAWRQLAELRLLDRDDLRDGRRNVGVRLKEYFDDGKAGQGLRFDVFDVVDRGREASLVDRVMRWPTSCADRPE